MKYRLGKKSDYRAIADLHYSIRTTYSIGIFAQLGRPFLRKYYRIMLNDPNAVVVCAYDDNGFMQGFCSATLDVQAQMANIRKHKIGLTIAALTSIFVKPSLFRHLYDRYKVINNDSKSMIISTMGARSEYWVWNAANHDSVASVEMYFALYNILKSLGIKELYGEIDKVNSKVLKFQQVNGGEIQNCITLPDGRERLIIKVNLENWKYKI